MSSKFTKKITHIDDMMIHNLVKYLVQTRLRSGLKFVIFISHKLSRVLTRYFTRLYIIISSTCVIFFGEFRQLFYCGLYGFSQSCGLHQICSHYIKRKTKLTETTTHWDVNHWETKGAHAFHRPHAPLGNGNKLNVVQRFIACRDPRLFVDEPLKKDTMFFTWG